MNESLFMIIYMSVLIVVIAYLLIYYNPFVKSTTTASSPLEPIIELFDNIACILHKQSIKDFLSSYTIIEQTDLMSKYPEYFEYNSTNIIIKIARVFLSCF